MYRYFFKRIFDFVLSLIAIIILSPVFIIVSILVRIKLGSPVIFKQRRPGKDCRIFTMFKFRTMTNNRDEDGKLLPDSERLTKFGSFLRRTSLDELPGLFNILLGHMSIVGPRPQLIKDMVFFDDETMRRQSVRPGLTGLAQINGRNNISWEDKFNYDLEYINKYTLWLDIKIIFKTVFKVFKKEDINTDGMATAEDYGDYLLRTGQLSIDEYNSKINELGNYYEKK